MNLTSAMFVNNSNTTIVESWFVPLNIISILCLILAIILAIIFLLIIIFDKTCHTVRMILIANICLTGFICDTTQLSIAIFTLQNDLKQIQYRDSFCVIRGYLSYASCALHCYSFVLLVIYQYMSIVYPNRMFWKSVRTQIFYIVLSWILAFVFPLLFTLNGEIVYNVDNQVCQMALRFSLFLIYGIHCAFIIPVLVTLFIYLKLIRYITRINKRIMSVNILFRAQRDLKLVRRIVILLHILLISGFPLCLFVFLSFFNLAPKYHFRIGFVFLDGSLPCVMIALFQFTDLLKAAVTKLICGRTDMVISTPTVNSSFHEMKTMKNRHNENIEYKKIEVSNT